MTAEERLAADGYAGADPVLFYYGTGEEWSCFSNFSPHRVSLPDPFYGLVESYETSEHRFQAMKADVWEAHRDIRLARGPSQTKLFGSRRSPVEGFNLREGWGEDYGDLCWYVMFEVVLAKAIQNQDVMDLLVATDDRPMYEDSPTDDKWGWRYHSNHSGKNLLGQCWMDVREVLR